MQRTLKLGLGRFGAESLRGEAARHDISVDELFAGAAHYYLAQVDQARARARLRVPRLVRQSAPANSGLDAPLELTIGLLDSEWKVLLEEAQRQQVTLQVLLEHAVMVFLGDMDGGRMGFRVLERPN